MLDHGIQFHGVETKAESLKVTGKLDFPADHPMLEHFKFLKAITKVTPKMTIPSPSVMHFRGGRAAISKQAYPDMDGYFDDLAKLYGKAIKAFYDAGCRYLQLDDTVWAYLCSKEQMAEARAARRGRRPAAGHLCQDHQHGAQVQAGRHGHHHPRCRGNFRSTWISEGGYEPVAELLLGRHRLRRLFPGVRHRARRRLGAAAFPAQGQEARGGGPRHLQEWRRSRKRTTSSAGSMRPPSMPPLDQLCLCPQCGFASTEEGNVLAEDEQWAKLDMIVEIAREVWR